jgi:hypothetical protein
MMRVLLTLLAALALVAGGVGGAEAKSKKKRIHHGGTYSKYYRAHRYRDNDDSIGGYYEHRLEAVRFGSQRWWKIYEEQQGGRRR